jgi:glycogen operon protein
VKWLTPSAAEMGDQDWNFPDGRWLSYVLGAPDEKGQPIFIVLNGADDDVEITLPEWPNVAKWQNVLDTSIGPAEHDPVAPPGHWTSRSKSVLAFAGEP